MPAFLAGGIREHLRFLISQLTLSPALSPALSLVPKRTGISVFPRFQSSFVGDPTLRHDRINNCRDGTKPTGRLQAKSQMRQRLGVPAPRLDGLDARPSNRMIKEPEMEASDDDRGESRTADRQKGGSLLVPSFSAVGAAPNFVAAGGKYNLCPTSHIAAHFIVP
jgi:hypothetical protein